MGSFSLIQETGRLNEKRKIGKQNKHIFDYAAMVRKNNLRIGYIASFMKQRKFINFEK